MGLGRGWACIGIQLHYSKTGPSGAEYGRVGPVRVEWGWGGVGHALGLNFLTLKQPSRAS